MNSACRSGSELVAGLGVGRRAPEGVHDLLAGAIVAGEEELLLRAEQAEEVGL
jgi:hypothetical protein